MKHQKQTKRQNLKKILLSSVVLVGLSAGSVQQSYAQIPVYDAEVHQETLLQYILQGMQWIKQQMQYVTQSKQFATQLENLLAIASFIWTRAHDIYNTINLRQCALYLSTRLW